MLKTTTTSHLQVVPNFFTNKEECDKNNHYTRPQSNMRYKGYTQTHFTCGDEEQFEEYRDWSMFRNGDNNNEVTNIFTGMELNIWDMNRNLSPLCVTNTFRYIFHKFKKGIYIRISDGKLKAFLPFSKYSFENEWHKNISTPPGFSDNIEFIKHIYELENRPFNIKKINRDLSKWIGNNAIIRFEYPSTEEDTGIPAFADMFQELCEKRQLPDVEFFFNKRDFPIIKRNLTEAYDNLFGVNTPLVSNKYEQYSPILGCSTTNEYADIPCPTWDDWSRVSSLDGKMFTKSNFDYNISNNILWEDKINIAVFRGSSTGEGVTIETNPRLRAAYMSSLNKIDKEDDLPFLDAGITGWNIRPRKLSDVNYLQTIEIDKLPFKLVNKLSPSEQCKYKYILHIQGHVAAYRLSLELGMKSVILKVDSKYKIWYSDMLQPYVHYVPVKSDLSDLYEKIKWCKKNDDKCKKIAENAYSFYKKYLTKDGILDYLQMLMYTIKNQCCTYNYMPLTPKSIQYYTESNFLSHRRPYNFCFDINYEHKPSIITSIKDFPRTSAFLGGISEYLLYTNNRIDEISDIPCFKTINVDIFSAKILDKEVLLKKYNTKSSKEAIHEAFIGIKCINNLMKIVPNFAFTYGIDKKKKYIIREKIEGITLHQYLTDQQYNFSFTYYINILLQIFLALQVAQNEFCFIHWDLMPWNIVLMKLKEKTIVEYPVSKNKVYKVETDCIPVIIDYGKSHAVIDDSQWSRMNMFSYSSVQDCLNLLLSSMYSILVFNKISNSDMRSLFELTNLFTSTEFRKDKFSTVNELKKFLERNKKYSVITTSKKYELEEKSPIDFVDFIRTTCKPTNITICKKCNYSYDDGDGYLLISNLLYQKTVNDLIENWINNISFMPIMVPFIYQDRQRLLTQRFYKKMSEFMVNTIKCDKDKYERGCNFLFDSNIITDYDDPYIVKEKISYKDNINEETFFLKDELDKIIKSTEQEVSIQSRTIEFFYDEMVAIIKR